MFSFPSIVYLTLSFLKCMFLALCWETVCFRCVDSFVGCYSGPVVYVSVLMPLPCCFVYYGSVAYLKIRYCDVSCFLHFTQHGFGYSGNFVFPYEFLDCCSVKNVIAIFRNFIEPIVFWVACQFYCINSSN